MNRTVIISGGRNVHDYRIVVMAIESCPWRSEIAHVHVGDADGVDKLALRWCKENGITYSIFRAEWDTWGKQAGPLRNEEMVQEGGTALILIWDGESKGSASMKRIAKRRRIPIYEVTLSQDVIQRQEQVGDWIDDFGKSLRSDSAGYVR